MPKLKRINLSKRPTSLDFDENEKDNIKAESEILLQELYDLLYLMYAENRRSLLIILQGIDTSGKDGTIRHIVGGCNPQGVRIFSFKKPSEEELRAHFLWRCQKICLESGYTTIFNRSYYEDVLTTRVHPEFLKARHLPTSVLKDPLLFAKRFRQINDYERMLTENGTLIAKFFLHISKDEQKDRLQQRILDPKKNWKFSPDDLKERRYWSSYKKHFEEMISHTDTSYAPWHIIPADLKWYRNYLVTKILVRELRKKKMKFPHLDENRVLGSFK